MRIRKFPAKAAVAFAVLAVFAVLCFSVSDKYVLLTDGDTGKLLGAFPCEDRGEFSVSFIHSVNQTPVTDVYEVRGRDIFVVRTAYFSFGAGVQTELQDGQRLIIGEDGSMTVSGFEQKMDNLSYIVGTVSDHVMEIGGRTVSLRELCGKNTTVRFSVGRRFSLPGGRIFPGC